MDIVDKLREAMDENSAMVECHIEVVRGVGHAFAHHPRSDKDEEESQRVFHQATEFLKRVL